MFRRFCPTCFATPSDVRTLLTSLEKPLVTMNANIFKHFGFVHHSKQVHLHDEASRMGQIFDQPCGRV